MAGLQEKYKTEVLRWQRRNRNDLREWRLDIMMAMNQEEGNLYLCITRHEK